ncbi:hypothetical protein INT47_003145 [Mucor saturninus]|uniref:Uncharacterized protein n=1 Tax=Mucor saturninus TaxID=64648 RepID=A0A8H7QZT5_9FUNG|nr:hypothetical protein INT47_003145 [Mucor saturninus]
MKGTHNLSCKCVCFRKKRQTKKHTGFAEVKADYRKNNAHKTYSDLSGLVYSGLFLFPNLGLNITACGCTIAVNNNMACCYAG